MPARFRRWRCARWRSAITGSRHADGRRSDPDGGPVVFAWAWCRARRIDRDADAARHRDHASRRMRRAILVPLRRTTRSRRPVAPSSTATPSCTARDTRAHRVPDGQIGAIVSSPCPRVPHDLFKGADALPYAVISLDGQNITARPPAGAGGPRRVHPRRSTCACRDATYRLYGSAPVSVSPSGVCHARRADGEQRLFSARHRRRRIVRWARCEAGEAIGSRTCRTAGLAHRASLLVLQPGVHDTAG